MFLNATNPSRTHSQQDEPKCFSYLKHDIKIWKLAPGYEPLPKHCSLPYDDLQSSELVIGKETLGQKTTNSDSGTNDPDTLSGSSNEESASAYTSERFIDSSVESDGTGSASDACDNGNNNPLLAGHVTEDDDTRAPLIHLSDAGVDYTKPNEGTGENSSVSFSGRVDV
ncbi:hypothetical protein AAC387_Pa03g2435 [Persea americana]